MTTASRRTGWLLGLGVVVALAGAWATPARSAPNGRAQSRSRAAGVPPPPFDRHFLLGAEGVVTEVPSLRSTVVTLDPRRVGNAVALGGAGLVARYRLVPAVAFELNARSGSLRYKESVGNSTVAHDIVLFSAGVLLYVVRGDIGHLAVDGGIGGIYNRIGYDLDRGSGVQHYGSGHVQAGLDAEFLIKRIVVLVSLRSYGVWTNRDLVSNRGSVLLEGPPTFRQAPVPALQTYVAGSAGLAYRF